MASPDAPQKSSRPFVRVLRYFRRYPGRFFLSLGLALASTAFGLAPPKVMEALLTEVAAGRAGAALGWGVAALTGCYLLRDVLNSLRIRVNNWVEQRVLLDLRADLHSQLLRLPVAFYDKRKTGEIANRVVEDVTQLQRAILDGTEQGLVAVLTFVGVVVMMALAQPWLTLAVLAPIPVLVFLGFAHAKAQRKNWKAVRESMDGLNSLLIEDIGANRLITSFALEERERGRFRERGENVLQTTLLAMYRWSVYGPGTTLLGSLSIVAAVGGGAWLIEHDPDFGFPQFIAFLAYTQLIYGPVERLNSLNHLLAGARAAGERVFEVLDHPVDIADPAAPLPFPAGPHTVRYEGVAFAYPDRPECIQPLDLTLPPGAVTALVGHTGAGKSTLAALLLRYYDASAGRVTVNGVDVRQLRLRDLRGAVGYVAQDPFLFDGTVADNLRLARPEATPADLQAALEGARAWDFVRRLPQGVDTLIGERGIRLSMGEKQRLTIARVLLKDPPLIVLDEATASVDTLTERAIQEALETLMRGRTVLVIAHRLSTVRRAAQIVVLEHGRVVETGTHDELCARPSGHYHRLWAIQADLIDERPPA